MRVLAIDTSLFNLSAALVGDNKPPAVHSEKLVKGHAEKLPVVVDALLGDSGVSLAEIDRLIVTCGPGGFTGVRVGLAFARGARAAGLESAGVDTLRALALSNDTEDSVVAIVGGPRGQVFAAAYDGSGVLVEPFAASEEAAVAKLHNGAPRARVISTYPLATELPGGWRLFSAAATVDPVRLARYAAVLDVRRAPPDPLYLRAPDAAPAKPSVFAALTASHGS